MKLIVEILLIPVVIAALAVLFIIGSTIYWFATKQSDLEVASGVNISTNWLELTPKLPLKATKQVGLLVWSRRAAG